MKLNFEKLTPINNVDVSVYEEALDFAFNNEDVTNIAVSGPYGAGKSSVLSSYEEAHQNKKFLHVSLAHFEDDEKNENYESILEKKILNQLIHQIDPQKIPQTNFKVKKAVPAWRSLLYAGLIMATALLLLSILLYLPWKNFLKVLSLKTSCSWIVSLLKITLSPWFRLSAGIIIALIAAFFLFTIVRAQFNRNMLKKLSFNGTEIELFEDCKDSFFDKYLNEILYLFKKANVDAVVFEDIDRYDNCKIFERLREINLLINKSKLKKKTHVIRFFYLMRDDIFSSKDRTKFFDFIVPIIPVVDGSNSYNQFKEHLEKNNLFEKFDSGFLQGVSLYVDEMRVLKNICNEFLIYYHRIASHLKLNYNKMLAMVIYKNLFPKDFSDLQLGRGFVASLFQQKKNLIKEEINKAKEELEKIQDSIEQYSLEAAKSKADLDTIFKEKVDHYFKSRSNWQDYLSENDRREYKRRLKLIEDNVEQKSSGNETSLETLEKHLARLHAINLSELINRDNINTIFGIKEGNLSVDDSYVDVKSNDYFNLLKYLVRNGYIDETYPDYLTYFYPNSLGLADKNFLIGITDKVANEYSYELNNPKLVFSRLAISDFNQEEILNFSLLEYLLINKIKSEELSLFLEQLKRTRNFDFVFGYFSLDRQKSSFVKALNQIWPDFFVELFVAKQKEYPVAEYIISSLYNCNNELIAKMNVDQCLTKYISKDPGFLAITNPDVGVLIDKFKALKVLFEKFDPSSVSHELLFAIYENSLYVLSYENITLMLNLFYPENTSWDIVHQNYSFICSQPKAPLHKYVLANIKKYVGIYLRSCKGEIYDSEAIALRIINNTKVKKEQKICYLKYLKECLQDLRTIKDKALWENALVFGALVHSENNAVEYYAQDNSFNILLIKYINEFSDGFDFKKIDVDRFDDSVVDEFVNGFIIINSIENNQYKSFVENLNFTLKKLNSTEISNEKMKILIDCNAIEMNRENLLFIRENYSYFANAFIQKNFEQYVAIMESALISKEELIEILSWTVKESMKLSLLKHTDMAISIIGKKYTNTIKVYIFKNNRDDNDLPQLYLSFSSLGKRLKTCVYSVAVEEIRHIISKKMPVSKELYRNLVDDSKIASETKIELLVSQISRYAKEEFLAELESLGVPDFKEVFDNNKRPKIKKNSINTIILKGFVENKWIFGYKEDSIRKGYYSLRRSTKFKKRIVS